MLQRRTLQESPRQVLKAGQVLHVETRRTARGEIDHKFTGDFTVGRDGILTFGLGSERLPLKVDGLSVDDAAQRLALALVDAGLLMQPEVTASATFDGLTVTATKTAIAAQKPVDRERKPYLDYVAGLDPKNDPRVERYLTWVNNQDAATLSVLKPERVWVWALNDPNAPQSPRDVATASFNQFFLSQHDRDTKIPKTNTLAITRAAIALYEFGQWIDRHQESAEFLTAEPATVYGQIVAQITIRETNREGQARLEELRERKQPTRGERAAKFDEFWVVAMRLAAYSKRTFPYSIDMPSRRKAILVTGDPALQKVLDDLSAEVVRWATGHLMDSDFTARKPLEVLADIMASGGYDKRITEAQKQPLAHEEQSTVEDKDISARGVLVSFGETVLKGLGAIAAVGLFVGAEIITAGQATWLLAGLMAMDGVQSYMSRRATIEAAGYDVPVADTLLESAGDVIGVSEVIEGISGQELSSGLELTGVERDERIGGAAGNAVLLLTGSYAYEKGLRIGLRYRGASPRAAGRVGSKREPAPKPGAKERTAREALTKELRAGFDLWIDQIRAHGRDPEIVLGNASARQVEGVSASMRRRVRQEAYDLEEDASRSASSPDPLRPKRSTSTRVNDLVGLHYDGAPPPPLDVALAVKIAEDTGEPVQLYGPEGGGKSPGRYDGTIGSPPRRLSLDLHRLWQDAGLLPSGLERLLAQATHEQVLGLSRWLPTGRLDAAGADAALIKRALALDARIAPQLSDPRARDGILRLTELNPKERTKPTSTTKLLGILEQIPEEAIRSALRVMADPSFGHPQAFRWDSLLGKRKPDLVAALQFADEFGYEAYTTLSDVKLAEPLRKDLAAREGYASRQARVEQLLDMSTVGREIALGIRRPPPFRRLTEAKPDTADPAWKDYLADAKDVVDRNAELTGPRTKQAYGKGNRAAIEAYATILQVRDRIISNFARYQKELSYDAQIGILDQIDALGAKADLQSGWVNNLRGSIGEALFGPNGGQRQKRLANPLHPAKPRAGDQPGTPPRPGFTRLDDSFEAGQRPRESGSGVPARGKDWVEIKTDRIDAAAGAGDVTRAAVDVAKAYARDAREDWDALLANAETSADNIVMQFARKPRTDATRAAMLKELFSKDSPIKAVRFGDESWIERPPDAPMPAVDSRLRDGPILGVPRKPHVYGPEP